LRRKKRPARDGACLVISISDIERAAERLIGVSVHTPLLQNFELDQAAGGTVLLKPECLQIAGAFKIRGAYNRLSQLSEEEARNGVVANRHRDAGGCAQGEAGQYPASGWGSDYV